MPTWLLAQSSGDWWSTMDANWESDPETGIAKYNKDVGFGRFKYLTNDWQIFSFHSLTEAQLRANPPPFVLQGLPK